MKFETSVLVLAHSNYLITDAGVEKVIQGQEKLFLQNRVNFIVVYPIRKDVKFIDGMHKVTTEKYGLIINGQEKEEIDDEKFYKIIKLENLNAIIIHELVTFRKNNTLLQLFDQIRCPIYYYVHDYAMVCYSHTLMRNNREFCGEKPLSFKKCYKCKYYVQGKKNAVWQQKFVKRHPNIIYIFPSALVRDIWKMTFKVSNELLIVPNTKFGNTIKKYSERIKNEKIRMAFIGYGRIEKGWNTWEKICKKYDKIYDLYVLGDGESEGMVKKVPVSVSKDGPNAMIDAIKKYNIDIAFLWSTCPETYSYTFYESYVSGCYIITCSQSGNIASMTKEYHCGKVFENEERLFAYLEDYDGVDKSIAEMHVNNLEYPTRLENNDEILEIFKGEKN